MSFYNPRKWKYVNVKGLGLIRGIHCPHYNGMTRGIPRRKDFRDMIRKTGGVGIVAAKFSGLYPHGIHSLEAGRRCGRDITELERLSFMRQGYIRPGKTIPRQIMYKRREIGRRDRG